MPLREGDFVKHSLKDEWGVGKVIRIDSAGKGYVQFSNGDVKAFTPQGSDKFVPADGAEFEKRTGVTKRRKPVALCNHCQKPLNRSRWSIDRVWKSCPQCSVRNGDVHVFRPYPDAFGTTDARASEEDPEGPQSYCAACRRGVESTEPLKTCRDNG